MNLQLSGKKVLVSGGSRGIGRAIVESLLSEGCLVSTCGRTPELLDTLSSELNIASLHTFRADISDPDSVGQWIESSAKSLGGVDGIILNASAMATSAELDAWQSMLNSDLLGSVHAINCALPFLQASSSASVLFINSTASVESAIDVINHSSVGPYGSIKAALLHYASMLSTQLAPDGIRVNSISPGPIEFSGGVWDHIKQNNPSTYNAMRERCRLGRLGKPSDVANAALFLISESASFVTGSNLIVDGGATRRVQF